MSFRPSHPALDAALAARGYEQPTPVQAAVLASEPHRDLLVSAQTGSGKTVAFGLAMASTLLGEAPRFARPEAPLALVIAPTRELALQVMRELTWLYAGAGARVLACVGGMDARAEARALATGAHIVVGTPGRLRDHLERGNLDLSALRVAVLDEADEMLDLGFREDLEFILEAAPAERRTLLFSATLARDIVVLAGRYQSNALRIDTVSRDQPHGDIEYRAVRVAPNEVEHAVVNVLRWFESPGALVFCHTREAVRHLYASLRERGFAVVGLSGEMSQRERTDALQALRDGHARVCVATDVAARGLDLPDLGLVIHADLPVNKAALLHRSGRTGRAGRKGVSVLITPYTRRRKAEMLLGAAGVEAYWSGPPMAEEIRRQDEARLIEAALTAEPPAEEDLELGRKLLEQMGAEQIAAALIRQRRAALPAPEELYDDGRGDQRQERGVRPARERPERERHEREPRGRAGDRDETAGDGVWFRLNVGRRNNADPKWLLPMICRLGHVTKREVGVIRIFDGETKFEIAPDVAERFFEAVQASGREDVRIEPAGAPSMREERPPRQPRPRTDAGPREDARPARTAPHAERPARAPAARDYDPLAKDLARVRDEERAARKPPRPGKGKANDRPATAPRPKGKPSFGKKPERGPLGGKGPKRK
jgi:ATP-dependent RNA helicase DeaD